METLFVVFLSIHLWIVSFLRTLLALSYTFCCSPRQSHPCVGDFQICLQATLCMLQTLNPAAHWITSVCLNPHKSQIEFISSCPSNFLFLSCFLVRSKQNPGAWSGNVTMYLMTPFSTLPFLIPHTVPRVVIGTSCLKLWVPVGKAGVQRNPLFFFFFF